MDDNLTLTTPQKLENLGGRPRNPEESKEAYITFIMRKLFAEYGFVKVNRFVLKGLKLQYETAKEYIKNVSNFKDTNSWSRALVYLYDTIRSSKDK